MSSSVHSQHSQNPQQIKCADKFTLQVYVRGIHVNLVKGIHLHFGTCLNTCLWNPGTDRLKIVRLSSAQFGLAMRTGFQLN